MYMYIYIYMYIDSLGKLDLLATSWCDMPRTAPHEDRSEDPHRFSLFEQVILSEFCVKI